MRFDRVRLRNFKPYDDADLRLDRGVSVVLGPNGSGKSSLLEASFFALYGSKALGDVTLGDLITRGESEAEIELWFTHAGDDYHVRRRLRATDDRARTAECVMETPSGVVEGATAVRSRVVEMVRMDAEAFVNSAYVRQGEVNKLIHATPGERQDMIDDLLQLGKLETYRERAGEARLGVSDLLEGQREVVENLTEQVDAKDEDRLYARLDELESERTDVDAEIERFEQNREQARQTRDDAQAVLDRHEEAREELADLEATIESLRETVTDTEQERADLQSTIEQTRERRAEHETEREKLLAAVDADALRPDPALLAAVDPDDGEADALDLPERSALALDPAADPETVEAALAAAEAVEDALQRRLNEAELRARELDGERERLAERAEELASEAEDRRETADDLEAGLDSERETLRKRRERLSDLDEEIDALESAFEDAPVDSDGAETHRSEVATERDRLAEDLQDLRADRRAVEDRIEEAEELLAAGRCPECGQPVEDSPHVDRLEEDRDRLASLRETIDERETDLTDAEDRLERAEELAEAAEELDRLTETRRDVRRLIEDKADAIAEDEARVAELRERADELETAATEKREAAASVAEDLERVRARTEDMEAALSTVRSETDRVERVVALDERIAEADERVASLQEERERLGELNDERRERLAEKRTRREELREEFDEATVEKAREELQRARNYLEDVEAKLDQLRERRDELKERIGGVNAELEQLEELRERRAAVERRVEALASLHEEVEGLETTYGDLRSDLRRRNVEVLERMLNDTFELVYGGDSYAGIDLGEDYALTVYQKDGEELDPEQLSGGERALFNLSLRCAIYRLLAEGVEGTAPLPPLILDEPTVFLDDEHVSRLRDLIEEMRDLGVEQIVVVTHDETLVDAADSVVRVRKDPVSNRSTVERVDALDAPTAE